jgi:hypothetical protein
MHQIALLVVFFCAVLKGEALIAQVSLAHVTLNQFLRPVGIRDLIATVTHSLGMVLLVVVVVEHWLVTAHLAGLELIVCKHCGAHLALVDCGRHFGMEMEM